MTSHDRGAQHEFEPAESAPVTPRPEDQHKQTSPLAEVRHTRTRAVWTGLFVVAVIVILLLVFIVQNLDKTPIHLFFWDVTLPLGVSLLIAAIAGALIAGIIGTARIFQLRRAVKKQL
ncbi:LapA family protein [Williamsia sterculiae]|uniref:Uncharacterized integral membrane protein n=1 Tax=Williamsia sterculiae TaxID=1344003 RepID=A0A1N7GEK4_9NOCA|nr:lipopolysaccharide assembly protein LapA domain-containing protein [Williamsia sterculiae]SIS11047.1 Uncharacterized integral membrane protein [Williamsia sterculiae]